MIVNIVSQENGSEEEAEEEMEILHTDGLKAIQSAIQYAEQQKGVIC